MNYQRCDLAARANGNTCPVGVLSTWVTDLVPQPIWSIRAAASFGAPKPSN